VTFNSPIGRVVKGFRQTHHRSRDTFVTASAHSPFVMPPPSQPMVQRGTAVVTAACLQRAAPMIQLTRLNNSPLIVNSDLIKFVEQSPDTVLTLINGEKILVRETAEKVLERIVQFRRTVLEGIYPVGSHIPAMPATEAPPKANEGSGK
jgi:flagellar protein FlbD